MINQEQTFDEPINEGTTVYFTGTLYDHLGAPIPLAALQTLVVYVSTEAAPTTWINNRNGQSILNVNGGTVHATSGAWTLKLSSADNPSVATGLAYERRRVLVKWTYNGGGDAGSMEFHLLVRNLAQV